MKRETKCRGKKNWRKLNDKPMARAMHRCVKCGNETQTSDLSWKNGRYACSECGCPHFTIE